MPRNRTVLHGLKLTTLPFRPSSLFHKMVIESAGSGRELGWCLGVSVQKVGVVDQYYLYEVEVLHDGRREGHVMSRESFLALQAVERKYDSQTALKDLNASRRRWEEETEPVLREVCWKSYNFCAEQIAWLLESHGNFSLTEYQILMITHMLNTQD